MCIENYTFSQKALQFVKVSSKKTLYTLWRITQHKKVLVKQIDFYTIRVPKDDTLIDDECFFNVEEMFVKDKRLHKRDLYFNVEEEEEIMDLFLNLPPTSEM